MALIKVTAATALPSVKQAIAELARAGAATRGSSPKFTTCVSPYRRMPIFSHNCTTNFFIAAASCIRVRSQSYRSMHEESPQ